MQNIRGSLKEARKIVVKVGTSTLTYENGKVNFSRIDKLVRAISDLVNQGREVVLVSSGAIGVGVSKMKLQEKPKTIREKQAAAAVGQCELMHIYSKIFADYSHVVAQVLLTRDVVEDDHRRENVINTFETLLEQEIVPIVNENDTVSIEEIEHIATFGDNDTLSAVVASLIHADLLIILSDIDGFYDCDPRENKDSHIIPMIREITPEIEGCAGGAGTNRGTGGMVTKLAAARIATSEGTHMVIGSGSNPEIILDILRGEDVGTLFVASSME